MKQHFESEYVKRVDLYKITAITEAGRDAMSEREVYLDGPRDEIAQGCINRIVDNLNKLAEHNAQNRKE